MYGGAATGHAHEKIIPERVNAFSQELSSSKLNALSLALARASEIARKNFPIKGCIPIYRPVNTSNKNQLRSVTRYRIIKNNIPKQIEKSIAILIFSLMSSSAIILDLSTFKLS